ncbi:putative ribonuclease H-like domain-containing protein [Tanacetum coccineum]
MIILGLSLIYGFCSLSNDVISAFLYGKIDEEVYVSQPLGFQDPKHPKKVYKVVKALYGLHQTPEHGNTTTEVVHFLAVDSEFLGSAKSRPLMATSTTEAEYCTTASCWSGQV